MIPQHTGPAIMSLLPWIRLLLLCVCARLYHLPSGWHCFHGGQDAQLTKSVLNGTDTSCANCIRKSGKLHKSNSSVKDCRSLEGPSMLYIQAVHSKIQKWGLFFWMHSAHQGNQCELFIDIVTPVTACQPQVSCVCTVYHEMTIYLIKWNLVFFNRIFTSHFEVVIDFSVVTHYCSLQEEKRPLLEIFPILMSSTLVPQLHSSGKTFSWYGN